MVGYEPLPCPCHVPSRNAAGARSGCSSGSTARTLSRSEVQCPVVTASLEERLRRVLDARTPREGDLPPGRPAAVLIMLFERDDEPWMVFTRRTQHVAHHKGEISFPGGSRDDD